MNSFLLFLGGLVVLALSALFAAPYFVDWNDYRDVFEAQASKLIGRNVDVGGDVSLTLLPAPVLRFETINVADAEGKFETPLAAARSFTVWLSVPPLLRGTIEARSVEIDQPVLNLRIAKDGSGNWSNIGGEAADLPFIPKEVALSSVEVSGATINLWRGDKKEPTSFVDNLNGELTARSLQGPYKFIGDYSQGDKRREVRFSTGRKEENGDFRLNASIRSPEVKETYSIDGNVRGFGAAPVFKGKFLARLADIEATAEGEDAKKDSQEQGAAPFEIKSELLAGFLGAQFSEAELTVTRNNKPQTIRGLMDLNYQGQLDVGGAFSSRWVDLDSWISSAGDPKPKLNVAATALAGEVLRRGLGVEKGRFKLFLDQAVIGGDLATNVQIELTAGEGKIELSRLSARLPGGARFRLNGTLSGSEEAPVFKGPFSVQGRSLSRLLRWAGVTAAPDATKQSGAFTLAGTLSAAPQKMALENGEGSLLGSAFSGGFSYQGGSPGAVSVTLKSDRMDLANVLGSNASAQSLWGLFGAGSGAPQDSAGSANGGALGWLSDMRADADVSIGAVSFAGLGESALDAKLTLSEGTLDIRKLNLSSGPEVGIQAGGRLSNLGGKPKGSLTLAVRAATGKGLSSLAEFFDLPQLAKRSPEQLVALSPLQLTTAVRSVESEKAGLEVQIKGALGQSNVAAKVDLEGTPAAWKTGQIAVNGSLTNKSGRELLQQLQPRLTKADLATFADGGGTLSLEASGIAETGLQTKTVLKAGGSDWTTQGTYRLGEGGNAFSGSTRLFAPNTAAGLSLFGIHVAPGHGSKAASVSADVESSGGTYRFSNVNGDLGGAVFSGEAALDADNGRTSISAQIKADTASLPRLLAPLVAWKSDGQNSQAIRGVSSTGAYWPDVPFSSNQLNRTDGSLSLTTERLRLAGDLVLDQAKFQAKLSDGTFKVSNLEGILYGGSLKASGELSARGDGVTLEAKVAATGLRLEQITATSGGKPLVSAPADISLSVRGVGLTPRGLASGLSGKGELDIGDGNISGFSLGAAHKAASSAQREKGKLDEAKLGRRVADSLKNSAMSFSQIKAPFTVSNGIIEFKKLALSDADGRVTVASYLQLSNLQLDSEWALQSADSASSGAEPRVSLVFAGPLTDIGKLQPKIDTTSLARYVTIRKMERDVERLEKLDVSPSGTNSTRGPAGAVKPPKRPEAKVKEAVKKPSRAVQPKPPGPPPPSAVAPPPPAVSPPPVAAVVPKAPVTRRPPAPLPARKPLIPRAVPPPAQVPANTTRPTPVPAPVPAPSTAARTPAPVAPRPRAPVQVTPPPSVLPQPVPPTSNNLPWLQPTNPPGVQDAVQGPAPVQRPVPVPNPYGVIGGQPHPPGGQVQPPLQEPVVAPPPARRRAPRFDPFAESGN